MSKKSMFLVFAIFVTILLIGVNIDIKAHSAARMDLNYNLTTEELDVTISHSVANQNTHYISSVEIKVNNSTISTETYFSQPTTSTFVYQYSNITAIKGDTIMVIAICNYFGLISSSTIAGEDPPQSGEPEIPGYLGIWIIIMSSIIALLTINFKRIRRMKK
ncbi:hypothetical protein LCGC14_0768150 [marine sediment metagenome]|uniref:Uncharacterized protein n=1 Tax=marine sediment metagenome TaxID=412755 RepID=A0A0F9T606_9ZZZZ